jgi:glyoxylase-like metal-dependent hydrolase (beta-lactamase superfamily II)
VLDEVVRGVWRAGTHYVNWYVVDGGSAGLTVVDTGLPGYAKGLDGSLAQLGRRRADVTAVLLTHGHVDHTGMASALAASGAHVHLHPADASLAANPRTNRPERTLPYLLWPATAAFVAHALRQGALRSSPAPPTVSLVPGATVDVPGQPLVTHVPGHTAGSCLLEFREHGVVFVGDLLCTRDPITGRRTEPQLQTRGSNSDSAQALLSLQKLQHVSARVVLPGHGSPWTDGVASAAASARRFGCR